MTDITKKYKNRAIACTIISSLLTIVPILIFMGIAFKEGAISSKIALGMTALVSIIMCCINVVFKYHIRSTIWILLLGISTCLQNLTTLLICIAVATVLDEFVFGRLAKSYRQKYNINKEIDKRG